MELVFDMIVILGDYFVVEGVCCCWLGWGWGRRRRGIVGSSIADVWVRGKVKWRRGLLIRG